VAFSAIVEIQPLAQIAHALADHRFLHRNPPFGLAIDFPAKGVFVDGFPIEVVDDEPFQ